MKKILYFGLEVPEEWKSKPSEKEILHYPLIKIEARPLNEPDIFHAFAKLEYFTHILLTSKTGVRLFFQAVDFFEKPRQNITNKIFIAVGRATAKAIESHQINVNFVAKVECSEGITHLLNSLNLLEAKMLWPCSALSRDVISTFCRQKGIYLNALPLYTSVTNCAYQEALKEELPKADELIFTSPSTVDAFIDLFGSLPKDKLITPIGPITAKKLADT